MFSKLLQDLDELSEKQTPFIEKQLDAISETLSAISNQEEVENETEMMEFGISFPWNVKKEEIVEPPPASESESEASEESVEAFPR